ncbi:MAG TPA: acetylglutamate kinase [Phycisphaerae bacterium]|nr:acetylglutamate kinase [Phycisphaerae bacterium]
MQEAIAKANTLIEALGYIQRFADRIVVVKVGGSLMDNEQAFTDLLSDVVFMNTVGMRPVIVHGGGKAITNAMEKRGLKVQFVQGRRYTDQRTLNVVEHVLCNEVNRAIVATIETLGSSAMGLHTLSSCVLFGERLFLEEDGRKIDLGLVGRITSVNARLVELLCQADTVPVLAPLARDKTGTKLNCNADTAAGEVAAALRAEKFVVVSDTHGVRRDPDDPDSLIDRVGEEEIRKLVADGVISGGMMPKVEACLRALEAGVNRAHIIDGHIPHALLLEIFSHRGVGTLIQKQGPGTGDQGPGANER